MKSIKNIVFLCMMGSGKSSIGKLVSKKLKLDFFDIDRCIEKELNLSIAEIFKRKGETIFRDLEEQITLNILKKKNKIIALGGGAFLNKNIQKAVLLNDISFWLKWSPEIIIKRINNSSKRPLAFKANKSELTYLIKKRSRIYAKAMHHLNCDDLSKDDIVRKIINIYETN